jgi:hypothetical protein
MIDVTDLSELTRRMERAEARIADLEEKLSKKRKVRTREEKLVDTPHETHHGVVRLLPGEFDAMVSAWGERMAKRAVEQYALLIEKGGAASTHKNHRAGIWDYVIRGYICQGMRPDPKPANAPIVAVKPEEERMTPEEHAAWMASLPMGILRSMDGA